MQIHIYICMCIIIMTRINRKEERTIWTAELQLASSLARLLTCRQLTTHKGLQNSGWLSTNERHSLDESIDSIASK